MKNKYMIFIVMMTISLLILSSWSYVTESFTWQVSTNITSIENSTSTQNNTDIKNSTNSTEAGVNQLENSTFSTESKNVSSSFEKEVKENNISNNNSLNLTSGAGILIEQSTGEILYAHNIHEKLRPASVTKVMSLLLIMEQIDSGNLSLTDKIPCSQKASDMGGSQIWLDTREELTVDEMLKAMCVVSAND